MLRRCSRCKQEKPVRDFHRNQHYCKLCQNAHNKEYKATLSAEKKLWYRRTEDRIGQQDRRKNRAQLLRREMMAAYGGRCSCCGESEFMFLTLEHLNGGGNAHRKRYHKANRTWLDLKQQGWPKEGYTLLCWNCQMAKTHYGKCIHQQRDTGRHRRNRP